MKGDKVEMDMYFNMHKVKFSELNHLFSTKTKIFETDTKNANIFINLDSVIRRLSTAEVADRLRVDENNEYRLIANILNLVAHYRLYFKSKKMTTKIYLYIGYPFDVEYKNEDFVSTYRNDYKIKYMNDSYGSVVGRVLKNTLPILEVIVKYIGGVYLLLDKTTQDKVEPSVLPMAVYKRYSDSESINVLVTRDEYEYQYTDLDFIIIRPKHKADYLITKENVFEIMSAEKRVQYRDWNMSVGFIPIILSFIGDNHRSIPKIGGIGMARVMEMISKGIREGYITRDSSTYNSISSIIKDNVKEQVSNNYSCISIQEQFSLVENDTLFWDRFDENIVDLFNNVELKQITEKFFESRNITIMLNELLPEVVKPRVDIFNERGR